MFCFRMFISKSTGKTENSKFNLKQSQNIANDPEIMMYIKNPDDTSISSWQNQSRNLRKQNTEKNLKGNGK